MLVVLKKRSRTEPLAESLSKPVSRGLSSHSLHAASHAACLFAHKSLSVPARCLLSHARLALHIHARPSGTSRPGWDGGAQKERIDGPRNKNHTTRSDGFRGYPCQGSPPSSFFPSLGVNLSVLFKNPSVSL
ncbi:hypothetical protein NW759_014630 [Fusarium solani]|nr:hypothetical protein NW759_014630 [Fusarium solani]